MIECTTNGSIIAVGDPKGSGDQRLSVVKTDRAYIKPLLNASPIVSGGVAPVWDITPTGPYIINPRGAVIACTYSTAGPAWLGVIELCTAAESATPTPTLTDRYAVLTLKPGEWIVITKLTVVTGAERLKISRGATTTTKLEVILLLVE